MGRSRRQLVAVEYGTIAFIHIWFLFLCISFILVAYVLWFLIEFFGWSYAESAFYGFLRDFLSFFMTMYGVSMISRLLRAYDDEETFRKMTEARLELTERDIEVTDEALQQSLERGVLQNNFAVAASVMPMLLVFTLAAYYWQFTSDRAAIFTQAPRGLIDVFLFSADLALRGMLFDFMEHFEINLTDIKLNFSNYTFVGVSFAFRLYCAVVVLNAFIRYVSFLAKSLVR